MENPQPLACTESFSYGWLIETQAPHCPTSFRKNSDEYEDSFHFDVPVITSPAELVDADKIFSEGQMKADILSLQLTAASSSSSPFPNMYSSTISPFLVHRKRRRYYVLGKWSKKILHKCLEFVCKTFRKSSRVDDLDRKVLEARSWSRKKLDNNFDITTPASNAENSIHEAILYCKKSIG